MDQSTLTAVMHSYFPILMPPFGLTPNLRPSFPPMSLTYLTLQNIFPNPSLLVVWCHPPHPPRNLDSLWSFLQAAKLHTGNQLIAQLPWVLGCDKIISSCLSQECIREKQSSRSSMRRPPALFWLSALGELHI